MKKVLFCILSLTLFTISGYSKEILVSTMADFQKASKNLSAGDVIIIKSGDYRDWHVKVLASGTAKKPIIIKAEALNTVKFSGDVHNTVFQISGEHVILRGLVFSDCSLFKKDSTGILINLLNANNCGVENCLFENNEAKDQFMPLVIISGSGKNNSVQHNTFKANVNNMDVQVRVTKTDYPLYTLINNNTFSDKKKVTWANFNGGECIQVGQDPILLSNSAPHAIVRDNHFINCAAEPEVISNKSSANKYIHNTLENCEGELVMRGGHDCLVDSNIISGGNSGIRINGTRHIISHNIIKNSPSGIRLMYGMTRGRVTTGFYIAADSNLVNDNKISDAKNAILIGDSKNVDWTGKFDTKRYPSSVMQDQQPLGNILNGNVFQNCKNTITYN